jgi:hypothetical protein
MKTEVSNIEFHELLENIFIIYVSRNSQWLHLYSLQL